MEDKQNAPSNEKRVQATNDDSIVSKRSSCRAGYFKDDFLRFFVDKPSKRSALINLDVRCAAVRSSLEKFLKLPSKGKQIVSIGAGFDTSYFVLRKSGHLTKDDAYFEVDYGGVVERKAKIIQANDELKQNLQNAKMSANHIQSDNYKLLECDIRDTKTFGAKLAAAGIDLTKPTLFFAEVVMTYLNAQETSAVIRWAAATFHTCVFITYEQILPDDAFGRVMCSNLRSRGSPLLGVYDFPTIEAQRKRYLDLGFESSQVMDMNTYWNSVLSDSERCRVEALDIFDEHEEFKVKCAHYVLVTAWKDSTKSGLLDAMEHNIPKSEVQVPSSIESAVKWQTPSISLSGKKGSSLRSAHSACSVGTKIYVFGGYGGSKSHTRLNDLMVLDTQIFEWQEIFTAGSAPSSRMFHTATLVGKHMIILGGRESPNNPLNDLYVLNIETFTWTKHTASDMYLIMQQFRADEADIFGGRDKDVVFNDCYALNIETFEWSQVKLASPPSPRCSHSAVCVGKRLAIFGGLFNSSKILNDLWIVDVETGECLLMECKGTVPSPRFSHTATATPNSMIIIGGCSPGALNDVYILDTEAWLWRKCDVGEVDALMAKHCAVLIGNRIFVIGGGALCFSFGTFFNSVEVLLLDGTPVIPTAKQEVVTPEFATDAPPVNVTSSVKAPSKSKKKKSKCGEILRIPCPSHDEFIKLTTVDRKPFIITGADIGPCTKLWNPDHLKKTCGTKPISVHISSHKELDFLNKNYVFKTVPFSEFVDRVYDDNNTERYYLRSVGQNVRKDVSDVWQSFPEIADEFKVPSFCPMASPDHPKYFSSAFRISSKDTTLWTHYDVMDNILCEISGSKRVVLWHPSEVRHLYVNGSTSQVLDIDKPDLKRFPKFARASRIEGTLNPGEVLFIPAFWFHNVYAHEPCIAINIFWKDLADDFYEKKDLYGNKDLLIGAKAAKEAENVILTLQQLPDYYREFYAQRIIANIKSALSL